MTSNRAPTSRFIHTTTSSPTHNDILYKQGQRQYKISLVRYHRLCAAIQQKYVIREVPPDMSKGQLFPRKAISFTPYTEFALDPVVGIKLHPREDGTIHPGDIKVYKRWFLNNWKCREGGILYCIGESREFWNMVLNFHSEAGTTGMKAWDALFERLKGNVFDKQLVPCMWFAREAGCLESRCPFLHDKKACIQDRERVLSNRRTTLGRPTMRDISLREKRQLAEYREKSQKEDTSVPGDSDALTLWDAVSDDELDPEVDRIFKGRMNIRKICSNPECLSVKVKRKAREAGEGDENTKMMVCSRCKVTNYCSKECQTADWKRHKKEPCLPFEELVENDDMWDVSGQRKGTGHVNIHIEE